MQITQTDSANKNRTYIKIKIQPKDAWGEVEKRLLGSGEIPSDIPIRRHRLQTQVNAMSVKCRARRMGKGVSWTRIHNWIISTPVILTPASA